MCLSSLNMLGQPHMLHTDTTVVFLKLCWFYHFLFKNFADLHIFIWNFKLSLCPTFCNFPQKSHDLSIPVYLQHPKHLTYLHISVAMFIYLSLPVMPLPLLTLAHVAPYMAKFQWFIFYLVYKPVHSASLPPESQNVYEYIFQFSSVAQLWLTLCDPMNCSTPGLPIHHQLPEFTQTHVHWVSDAIQPSHPLLSPFPPAPNPSQQ